MMLNIIVEESDEDTITISTNGTCFEHFDKSEYDVVSAVQEYISDYWNGNV